MNKFSSSYDARNSLSSFSHIFCVVLRQIFGVSGDFFIVSNDLQILLSKNVTVQLHDLYKFSKCSLSYPIKT